MQTSFVLFISVLSVLLGFSAFAADGEFMADFQQSSSGQDGQTGKMTDSIREDIRGLFR